MPRLRDDDIARLKEALTPEPLPEPETWLQRVLKRRLVVHTVAGRTIGGTLDEVTPDGIILRAASFKIDQQPDVNLGGEVFIPREQVAFTQLLD